MRVTAVQHMQDCFDGSAVFLYHVDEPWTPDRIRSLRRIGSLDYFHDFPRPYYRMRTAHGLEIKGLEGECVCRVVFPKAGRQLLRQEWEEFFTKPLENSLKESAVCVE